ncbi:MAG: serine protease [Granulosicoccus sp.]
MALVLLASLGASSANAHAQGVEGPPIVSDPDAIVNNLSLTSRILGGSNAEVGEWPSVVGIVVAGNFPLEDRFFCGGTVIADRWVMTAAHCMFDPFGTPAQPGDIRVVAGTNDLQDPNAEETLVTNIIVHPDYDSNGSTLQNDIALLELGTALSATPTELFGGDPENYNDTMAFIVGWGATTTDSSSGYQYPTLLQDASVPLVSLAQCNSSESYQGMIAETQVCAGFRQGGIDSCVGDSGGPLYIFNNGQKVQVGITSFGNGCGLPNFYGVYTNVSSFLPWMNNYVAVSGNDSQEANIGNGALTGAAVSGAGTTNTEAGTTNTDGGTTNTDGGVTVGGRRKGGSVTMAGLVLLGAFSVMRQSLSRRRESGIRNINSCKAILAVGALAVVSGCSTYPMPVIGSEGDAAHTDAGNDVKESVENHSQANPLNLVSLAGKPGINELFVGADRAQIDQRLLEAEFSAPTCRAEKTALEGTGRLFLREFCDSKPRTLASLEGLQVRKLSLQFIDNQLVRIDTHMASGAAMALSKQLNTLYEHMPTASRPFEWRLGANHIRVVSGASTQSDEASGVLLQMIDGRLSAKLPALFAYL